MAEVRLCELFSGPFCDCCFPRNKFSNRWFCSFCSDSLLALTFWSIIFVVLCFLVGPSSLALFFVYRLCSLICFPNIRYKSAFLTPQSPMLANTSVKSFSIVSGSWFESVLGLPSTLSSSLLDALRSSPKTTLLPMVSLCLSVMVSLCLSVSLSLCLSVSLSLSLILSYSLSLPFVPLGSRTRTPPALSSRALLARSLVVVSLQDLSEII